MILTIQLKSRRHVGLAEFQACKFGIEMEVLADNQIEMIGDQTKIVNYVLANIPHTILHTEPFKMARPYEI